MAEEALQDIMQMMAALRCEESGCPWDRKQTYESLTPHTLEETHEVIDAIESRNYQNLKDELGDLLFQVAFYSQIASEENRFNLVDVINHLVEKMQRRHPHVFSDQHFETEEELSSHWESVKSREKQLNDEPPAASSVLDNLPASMPALSRAQKLQRRASKTGFDWNDIDRVKEKIYEELGELDAAIASGSHDQQQHEIGDLLLCTVNLARHLDVDAEQALRLANLRFTRRFQYIENYFSAEGKNMDDAELVELEALWQKAKQSSNKP